jgi:DNA (cytosine-5)-methyltransferase 1
LDRHHNKYRVLDLFAGIGGFAIGLEAAGGFHTAAFSEIDPYASRVLATRWPDVPNLGDIRSITLKPDTFDMLTGGFPCQDISTAGRGRALVAPDRVSGGSSTVS